MSRASERDQCKYGIQCFWAGLHLHCRRQDNANLRIVETELLAVNTSLGHHEASTKTNVRQWRGRLIACGRL